MLGFQGLGLRLSGAWSSDAHDTAWDIHGENETSYENYGYIGAYTDCN